MSRIDFARLLRLPNVFTAFADIAIGALITLTLISGERWPNVLALFLASGCLYCAGMVFNDYFDLDEDRRDRPFRPLASGRVRPAVALRVGIGLIFMGCMLAQVAGRIGDTWNPTPLILAGVLVLAILGYDAWLKRTPIGPLAMGSCRFLNVLFGLSLLPEEDFSWLARINLAGAVGIYIVGVTWFARTEERTSRRSPLIAAIVVVFMGLLLGLALPLHPEASDVPVLFPYLLALFGLIIGLPAEKAIRHPTPAHVQGAVKRFILGLVLFDAVLAFAFVGWPGLLIVLLLPPALILGKWVYST